MELEQPSASEQDRQAGLHLDLQSTPHHGLISQNAGCMRGSKNKGPYTYIYVYIHICIYIYICMSIYIHAYIDRSQIGGYRQLCWVLRRPRQLQSLAPWSRPSASHRSGFAEGSWYSREQLLLLLLSLTHARPAKRCVGAV